MNDNNKEYNNDVMPNEKREITNDESNFADASRFLYEDAPKVDIHPNKDEELTNKK